MSYFDLDFSLYYANNKNQIFYVCQSLGCVPHIKAHVRKLAGGRGNRSLYSSKKGFLIIGES
jgi:hypothetical protein